MKLIYTGFPPIYAVVGHLLIRDDLDLWLKAWTLLIIITSKNYEGLGMGMGFRTSCKNLHSSHLKSSPYFKPKTRFFFFEIKIPSNIQKILSFPDSWAWIIYRPYVLYGDHLPVCSGHLAQAFLFFLPLGEALVNLDSIPSEPSSCLVFLDHLEPMIDELD